MAFDYYLKDHLGNTRVMITDDYSISTHVLEWTNYNPWGNRLAGISMQSTVLTNKYKYNGKELQNQEWSDGTGLEEYDYGARFLDPQLGVWHSIDPLADGSRRFSPYVYCNGNPVRFTDPDGMEAEETDKVRVEYNKTTGETTETYISESEYNSATNNGTENGISIQTDEDGDASIGTICDQNGNVLHQDKNPNVYMNDGKKTIHIGELGGSINSNTIISNILNANKNEAKARGYSEWLYNVLPKTGVFGIVRCWKWDYKDNMKIIFGVAWAYDQDHSAQNIHTMFSSNDNFFGNAADFGNFNAGYTGRMLVYLQMVHTGNIGGQEWERLQKFIKMMGLMIIIDPVASGFGRSITQYRHMAINGETIIGTRLGW